jgi:putative sterol carrier protein
MMAYKFPSEEYVKAVMEILNNDSRYAEIARNWEGDILFSVEPSNEDENDDLPVMIYMDLWHGRCRDARVIDPEKDDVPDATFMLTGKQSNFMKVLNGELEVMQSMITRKLMLRGSLTYMMRNVPILLDFLRCCSEVEIES